MTSNVSFFFFSLGEAGPGERQAYDEDGDEEHPHAAGGPGVQCASQ